MKKKIYIPIIIIFIITIFFINKSYSKYTFDNKDTRTFESTAFYFECSLEDNNNIYNINWDSSEEKKILFDVNNYINNLLITNEDIKYNISYKLKSGNEEDINIILKDEEDNTITNNSTFILNGQTLNSHNYKLIISRKKYIENNQNYSIEINIKSSEPYIKEINITFNLKPYVLNDYEYEIIEHIDYIDLKLQIYNDFDNNIQIIFNNEKLLLDVSDNLWTEINNNGTTTTLKLDKEKLKKGKSYIITLIKNNTIELEDDDIIVREDL